MNENNAEHQTQPTPAPVYTSHEEMMILRSRVADVMAIEDTETDPGDGAVAFTGTLRHEAEQAFETLKNRFQDMGYVPLLREAPSGQKQMVVAIRGSLQEALRQRAWVQMALFAATFLTTTFFGGMYAASLSGAGSISLMNTLVFYGLPFSCTLLGILAVHEFGHYLQARRHNMPVTLPYFIPMPFGLGTVGAFVQMRGAVQSKRALFDVGIGGPIAGLLVAIPLFVFGVLIASVTQSPAPDTRSLLMEALIGVFRPEAVSNGILLNPVLLGARFGLVVTALNLLPVGQLDGGHIAYAALGRRWAMWVSYATLVVMGFLGVTVSSNWLVWMFFATISGVQHAPPLNDVTPLDQRRNVAFLATFLLFLSLFTARPF